MKMKRIASAALALLMLVGCFSGCGKKDEPVLTTETKTGDAPSHTFDTRGRYVEKNLSLPESAYACDMVTLTDGQLRVALREESGDVLICTSESGGTEWEELFTLPTEITASGRIESVALSPDGTIFCDTVEVLGDDAYQPHIWVIPPSGEFRELTLDYPDLNPEWGFFIPYADFTEDGRLIVQVYLSGVHEIDLASGEFGENLNELDTNLNRSGCGGNDVYMMGWQSTSYHHDGETTALPDVLKTQLEANLAENEGNTPKMTFWKNQDGYLFFTTFDGLYSYIPGGSVTEELVNGSQTSLGDPRCHPVALTGTADGSFYLLCMLNDKPTLCHFTYDDKLPTVADTKLKIYSLYPDEDLDQMVSRFQKANLDISVELEVGLTGEGGMTEADAIRTLNTEILAGSGPDLICLDGFDLNTYLEKGLLADLSGVLTKAGPLLEQVTNCYGADGKVCAVPTSFSIPAIYGPEQIVSQIHDLPSLVAAAKQAREEDPEIERLVNGVHPVCMADYYYDSCSAAWMNADGTLNGEKLAQFYSAMKELYALDESFRLEHEEWTAEFQRDAETDYVPGGYIGLGGAPWILAEISYLPAGTLNGLYWWANAQAGEKEFLGDGYAAVPFSGQASNVFQPRRIMGILTTAEHPQAAETFLSFMLSDEMQSNTLSMGFPVNKVTFDRQIQEDGYSDSIMSVSDSNGNDFGCHAQWPNAEQRLQLKGWVDNLTTPANTNRTIRKMVMAQMSDCCNGIITPEQAAEAALQSLNLYLSE